MNEATEKVGPKSGAGEAAATGGSNTGTSYPQASLYVGDLAPEVVENQLFELFSKMGPVMSIRICRDAVSKASLGYGYVNYASPSHASKALTQLNFEVLGGKPIRLMWSHRDPTIRRAATGNIFIKNLSKDVDNKSLYDTFNTFGNILSAKLAVDERGNSKGFAFVHFQTEEAAKEAIAKVNGKIISGKKVFVGLFKARNIRQTETGMKEPPFTNVFIKNLNKEETTSEALREEVEKHGKVNSFFLATEQDTKRSKGYAFVAYEKPEEAAAAVAALNGLDLHNHKLYAGRAMKKEERVSQLKTMISQKKKERETSGMNLYVKNLEDGVTEARLQAEFAPFGRITSVKLMTYEDGNSRGFGFVCFSTPEEASKAVNDMNGRILPGLTKPLYVVLAQRKEDRARILASNFSHNRLGRQPGNNFGGGQHSYYSANTGYPPSQPNFLPSPRVVGGGRWGAQMGGNPMVRYPNNPYGAQYPAPPAASNNRAIQAPSASGRPLYGYSQPSIQQPTATRLIQGPARWAPLPSANPPANYQYNPTTRNRPEPGSYQASANSVPLGSKPTGDQKQILGEELYAHVLNMVDQASAGKVTGMLLEMPNAEIVSMLHQENLLQSKVQEAMAVLHESGLKH